MSERIDAGAEARGAPSIAGSLPSSSSLRSGSLATVREHRTTANGISIRYLESGPADAGDVVLLLHGGTGSARRHWLHQLETLGARGFRCIAPDHRGHAGTTNDREGLDQRLMADDEAALLGALGVPRAHVVGFSVGGVIGCYLALARPDLVRSLVTIGSHMTIDDHVRASNETVLPERIRRDDPGWARLLAVLHAPGQIADAWDGGVARESDYWQRLCREIHDTWELQPDWSATDLRAIDCPALVGRGALDERVVEDQVVRLAGAINGARTFEVHAVGHFFQATEPGRSALDAILLEWLSDAG